MNKTYTVSVSPLLSKVLSRTNNKAVVSRKYRAAKTMFTVDGRPKPKAADAVKDKATIQQIKQTLLSSGRYGYRNYLIYTVGINIGRRASDILKLRVEDVVTSAGDMRGEVRHIEDKTGKIIEFYLNASMQDAIAEYLNSMPELQPTDYLFKSQKGSGRLTTRSYWRILQDVQKQLELTDHLSTHTMRKTFGYHKYQEFKNQNIEGGFDVVDMLQDAYGHSSRKQTMTYIGISKENKKKLYCDSAL